MQRRFQHDWEHPGDLWQSAHGLGAAMQRLVVRGVCYCDRSLDSRCGVLRGLLLGGAYGVQTTALLNQHVETTVPEIMVDHRRASLHDHSSSDSSEEEEAEEDESESFPAASSSSVGDAVTVQLTS